MIVSSAEREKSCVELVEVFEGIAAHRERERPSSDAAEPLCVLLEQLVQEGDRGGVTEAQGARSRGCVEHLLKQVHDSWRLYQAHRAGRSEGAVTRPNAHLVSGDLPISFGSAGTESGMCR